MYTSLRDHKLAEAYIAVRMQHATLTEERLPSGMRLIMACVIGFVPAANELSKKSYRSLSSDRISRVRDPVHASSRDTFSPGKGRMVLQ